MTAPCTVRRYPRVGAAARAQHGARNKCPAPTSSPNAALNASARGSPSAVTAGELEDAAFLGDIGPLLVPGTGDAFDAAAAGAIVLRKPVVLLPGAAWRRPETAGGAS